jgi:hypothetical protein
MIQFLIYYKRIDLAAKKIKMRIETEGVNPNHIWAHKFYASSVYGTKMRNLFSWLNTKDVQYKMGDFTKDDTFHSFMRDEFEKVHKVRPLYGCGAKRGRIDLYAIEKVDISVFLDPNNNPLHRRYVVAFGGFTQLVIRGNLVLRLLTWSHLEFRIEVGGPYAGELCVRLINIFDKTHKISLVRMILRDDEKN